jgi:UDP-glucose 4-epimerase
MKVLITGKNSYIGSSVKAYIEKQDSSIDMTEISLRNIDLNSIDFSSYDVVFHVAGIAHISENKSLEKQYFLINRDLAIQVAERAKTQGVKKFIFASSLAIYGKDNYFWNQNPIEVEEYSPTSAYGKSKLEADLHLQNLSSNQFRVYILRLPMVYGPNSKGNLPKLERLADKLFILPHLKNIRSVLHIDNLSKLCFALIKFDLSSRVLLPQDNLYFSTSEFMTLYRKSKNKVVIKSFLLALLVFLGAFLFKFINKVFGNKFVPLNLSKINEIVYQEQNWKTYLNNIHSLSNDH